MRSKLTVAIPLSVKRNLKRPQKFSDELDEHDGDIDAEAYGPLRLQAQRERWVASGKARVYWFSRKKLYSPSKSLCWPSCISAPKRS